MKIKDRDITMSLILSMYTNKGLFMYLAELHGKLSRGIERTRLIIIKGKH